MRCDGRDNRKKLCDFIFSCVTLFSWGEGGGGGAVEERGGVGRTDMH